LSRVFGILLVFKEAVAGVEDSVLMLFNQASEGFDVAHF
jgi:hypothetical protein